MGLYGKLPHDDSRVWNCAPERRFCADNRSLVAVDLLSLMQTRSWMGAPIVASYVAFLVLLSGSTHSCRRSQPLELITFAAVGHRPFDDYLWTVHPDGSHPTVLVAPTKLRSCTSAAGNSLAAGLVITSQELAGDGTVGNRIYLHYPSKGTWQRLLSGELVEGDASISPDNSRVAFTAAVKPDFQHYRLFAIHLASAAITTLTDPPVDSWDASPRWNPNGSHIGFLRFRRTARGILSKLMMIQAETGEECVVVDDEEGVSDFCYAPKGDRMAVWTKRGLEVIDVKTVSRRVVLPIERINRDYRIPMGTLGWSKVQELIVYALTEKNGQNSELWTISSDGNNANKIYHAEGRSIRSASFVLR